MIQQLSRLLCVIFLVTLQAEVSAEEIRLPLTSGETLVFDRHAATGNRLLLWFAAERGFSPSEQQAAQQLAGRGIEVWQIDWVNALFLPQVPRSLDGVSPEDMGILLKKAHATGKTLALYATARAAVPVLNSLKNQQACVLLMHPNLYARAEALAEADYLAFEQLGQLDILVLQPMRSAATPWVGNQIEALKSASARVRLHMLEKLREGFWRREDATAFETEQGKRLADLLAAWMEEAQCKKV